MARRRQSAGNKSGCTVESCVEIECINKKSKGYFSILSSNSNLSVTNQLYSAYFTNQSARFKIKIQIALSDITWSLSSKGEVT